MICHYFSNSAMKRRPGEASVALPSAPVGGEMVPGIGARSGKTGRGTDFNVASVLKRDVFHCIIL